MNWIKCSDRLPDTDQEVLVFTDFAVPYGIAYICENRWYGLGFKLHGKVTHWAELNTPND